MKTPKDAPKIIQSKPFIKQEIINCDGQSYSEWNFKLDWFSNNRMYDLLVPGAGVVTDEDSTTMLSIATASSALLPQ